jgi:hypothetical protein
MPYPVLWDTGVQLQKSPTPTTLQDPMDDTGQYTAIVGVGREAVLPPQPGKPPQVGADGQPLPPRKDERCLIGGWGGESEFGGIKIKTPDPVSSWTELKLYQARTMRTYHQTCIGRYERLFKPLSSEDHALAKTGGIYNEVSKSCQISPAYDATGKPNNIDPANYISKLTDMTNNQQDENNRYSRLQRNYPHAWRGYVSDIDGATTFPRFGGNGRSYAGLDNAREGDILILRNGYDKSRGGLAKTAIVKTVKTTNCDDNIGCFVNVVDRDFGKFPDICGNTDALGVESNRNLYKPGTLPSRMSDDMQKLGSDGNCADVDLQYCEFADWSSVETYRIRDDARAGVVPKSLYPADSAGTARCETMNFNCATLNDFQDKITGKPTQSIDPAIIECCARAGWDAPQNWQPQ